MALLRKKLCTFYRRTVRIFFALVSAWLFVSCLVATGYTTFHSDFAERCWICPDSALLQSALFSLVCFIVLWKARHSTPSQAMDPHRFSVIRRNLVLFAGLLALLWVVCVQPTPNMDARTVQRAASDFHYGHTYLFEPGEYMYLYPNQSGLFLIHLALQQLNPNTTYPFLLLNSLCYAGIVYLLGEFALELGLNDSGCIAATCLGIGFLPLLFFVTFLYGTVPGLFFSMAGLHLAIRFSQRPKWTSGIGASIMLFLSVMAKSNYQIFAFGLILYLLYNSLRGKRHCLYLSAGILVGWLLAGKLPVVILEHLTGCNLHSGASMLSWVAMGLHTDSSRGPGWYNGYNDSSYFDSGMNPGVQTRMALKYILGVFYGYWKDPGSAIRFFVQKNATQWSDPLFQGIWLNTSMHEEVPHWLELLLDTQGPTPLTWLMNLLQTLIYGGLVLWAWVPTHEKRKPQEDLLAVILVGGFVFHTFWEAKSQYTLPYVVLVLPLALLGYKRLALLAQDRDAKALWQSPAGKLRFLMPVLLMVLAMVLAAVLAAPLNAALQKLMQTV